MLKKGDGWEAEVDDRDFEPGQQMPRQDWEMGPLIWLLSPISHRLDTEGRSILQTLFMLVSASHLV